MSEVVFECTCVDVSVVIEECALERGGGVEVGPFESLSSW